jgi:hypothetical protein
LSLPSRLCLKFPLNPLFLRYLMNLHYLKLHLTLKNRLYLCFRLNLCFRLSLMTRVYLMYLRYLTCLLTHLSPHFLMYPKSLRYRL